MFGAFREGDHVLVLMPYARHGDLAMCLPHLSRNPVTLARYVFLPVLSAIGYLHAHGIVHRDIKLENCLVQKDGTVMLTDLGFAIHVGKSRRRRALTQLGTMGAMAPEILLQDPADPDGPLRHETPRPERKEYGPAVDIWAFGVLAWSALTHRGGVRC